MKLDTFFEKFDLLADAPGAVGKMRELILHLAFSGKLIPTKHLWDRKSLKSLTTKIGSGATPSGGRESYFSSGIPLIRSMNVHFRGFEPTGLVFLNDEQARQLSNVIVQPHDVLLNITGASIGRVTTAPVEMRGARVNQHVSIIRPVNELDARFLAMLLASPDFQGMINEIQVGATRQALTKGMIERFEIPFPPPAEQKRIVAKVDELMALCDRLEAQQRSREAQHAALARASLSRFAEAPTPANLDFLFHPAYAIEPADIRKAILTLAVQGKLVPQDPDDDLVLDWLQVVAKSRINEFDLSESPFLIPDGWVWVKVADVFEVAGGIQKTPHRAPRQNAFPYLGVGNVYRGRLDLSTIKEFELEPGELERRRLESGDLLIIEGNGSFNEIGRCAKWKGEIPDCVHQNHVIRCRPCDVRLSSFVLLFLNSPNGTEIMQRLAITSSGLYSLSVGKIRQIEIPIPPLAEQDRIVARVDQLMSLVDQLETQIATSGETAAKLLDALVAELTKVGAASPSPSRRGHA